MRKHLLILITAPLFAICLLSFVISPAYATPMTGGGYTIPSLTISSGGAANSIGGSYSLQIMTGQTVIGRSTGTPYEAQLGGIYALSGTSEGGETDIIPGSETDNGVIFTTRIAFVPVSGASDRVRLSWAYREGSGVTQVDIWKLAGANISFSTEDASPLVWIKLNDAGVAGTTYDDNAERKQDGRNAYYRIVPVGTSRAQLFGNSASGIPNNARTVAKVDVGIGVGYNLITYPLNADTNADTSVYTVGSFFDNQLREGDQVHFWNQGAQRYAIATKVGASLNLEHAFSLGEGFFVYCGSAGLTNLSLLGVVGSFVAGTEKLLGSNYNLLGYPYPVVRSAGGIGIVGAEGDQLHRWDPVAQKFEIATFVGGAWNHLAMVNFGLGEGKFYYLPGTRTVTWRPVF